MSILGFRKMILGFVVIVASSLAAMFVNDHTSWGGEEFDETADA